MFDPYHKWLGIPPKHQPPNYYRLLGIDPDEDEMEVIEEAVIRQTAHLRPYQTGPYASECNRLLNEIAHARATLVDPKKKAAYNSQLKAQQKVANSPEQSLARGITKEPPREPAPGAGMAFACPACGKRLKVKGELAGTKIKCPHCKEAMRVPAGGGGASLADARTLLPGNPAARGAATASYHAVETPAKELYDFLAPPQAPDEIGRLGPYRVLAVLGAGGMGVVFRAEDPQLNRLVALKAMLPSMAGADSGRQRFLREARAAAAIKHDHIVAVYQVGEDRGVPFLAMEFLEGEPLDKRLTREGKLPVVDVLRFGREIALGLAAAHKRGLIHRDIKPANLWLEAETGRIKVLDFGLARAAKEASPLTQTGAIVGTPEYMAPEQVQGKDLDERCDLFSLGCVLYRMSTGEMPFKGTDMMSTLMAVATENPRPPRDLEPSMPAALSKLILRLLAKEPGKRPESAQAVAEALQELLERTQEESGTAGPKTAPRTSWFGKKKLPVPSLVGMAGGLQSKKAKSGPRTRWHWPAIAAGMLLAGILVAWAGGVFKVTTKQEVEVDVGGRRPISVHLEPLPPPAGGPVLAAGNLPDGKIPAYYHGTGKWRMEGNELILDSVGGGGGLGFGDAPWTDYYLTVQAQRIEGENLCWITFRCADVLNRYGFKIGHSGGNGWGIAIYSRVDGIDNLLGGKGWVADEKWHTIGVKVRGTHIECFMDAERVFKKDDFYHLSGAVGLATQSAATRFRNLKVTDSQGRILVDGIHQLVIDPDEAAFPTNNRFRAGTTWKGKLQRKLGGRDLPEWDMKIKILKRQGMRFEGEFWTNDQRTGMKIEGKIDPKDNLSWVTTGFLVQGGIGDNDFAAGAGVVRGNLIHTITNGRNSGGTFSTVGQATLDE